MERRDRCGNSLNSRARRLNDSMFSTSNYNGKGAGLNVYRSSHVLSHRQLLRIARKKNEENEKAMSDSGIGCKPPRLSSKGSEQQKYNENEENASSVSSPEEHAVSTMILALEKKGTFGTGTSVSDGTPIRSNLSKDEDDEVERLIEFKERISILGRARSKIVSRHGGSRVPFPKRHQLTGTVGIFKASTDHQEHLLSETPIKKSILQKQARSEGVSSAPRGSKQRIRQVRIKDDDDDCEDDTLSMQSDPTNDSSYYDDSFRHNEAGDAFLDHLIDLVAGDEEYSMDDETLHSKDTSAIENTEKDEASKADRYSWSQCMSNDSMMDESVDGYGKMSSSCHSVNVGPIVNVGTEMGKELLSDISSALSFNKEDSSKCKPMEAPTETGGKVNEEPKEIEDSEYASGCHVNSVFGLEKKEDKSFDTTISAPEDVPVQRIDSAHLTYISELTSMAHHVPHELAASMDRAKRSFQAESHRVFESIQTPLSFASQISGLASPVPEESRGDYEEELDIMYDTKHAEGKKDKNRKGTPIPAIVPEAEEETVNEESETPSSGFQLPNSPFLYKLRSLIKSPIPFSSNLEKSDDTKEKEKNTDANDEFAGETASNVMPKIQGAFGKINAANAAAKAKKENRTCGAQGSLEEVMESIQKIITCDKSIKKEEDKGEETFLSAISKSFSFWNKGTDDTNTNKPQDTKAPDTKESKRGEALVSEQDEKKTEEWENMDIGFPKTSSREEAKSNQGDDGSETSLQKDVTVTVHTIKLTFSHTDEVDQSSPSRQLNLEEEKDNSRDAKSTADEIFADLGHTNKKGQSKDKASDAKAQNEVGFANFQQVTSSSPPPSPEYKVPQPPGKKSLASARLYRRLKHSSSSKPQESKTTQGENDEVQLVHAKTWQTADDIDTNIGSWQDFKSGDVFTGVWPKESTSAQSETGQDDDPFKVTYKVNSSKWIRKNKSQQSKSPTSSAIASPQSVSLYGENNPEFQSFGRRSLLESFSGTTQGEF